MHDDWDMNLADGDALARTREMHAAIRAADDADWELDEALSFNEPFDPYADDPE
jgi:hypothetical protein